MSLRRQLERRLAEISRRGSGEVRAVGGRNRLVAGRSLDALVPGGREWKGESGSCWVYREDVGQTWSEGARLLERVRQALAAPPSEDARGWPAVWSGPFRTALDIETCGFASAPVFLIGLLETDGEKLALAQGVARDYGEEAALLAWAANRLARSGGIITFNGRTFDLPYFRDRQRYHRQTLLPSLPHLDLLPVARRIWRADLPDCRLQTLERHLTGRARQGDIPGREIPDVYHTFVDTGNARHMKTVLAHNRLDLIAVLELFASAWRRLRSRPAGGRE